MGVVANLVILAWVFAGPAEAKNCKNSQPCGNSCISWSKTCHVGSGSSTYTPPRTSSKSSAPTPKPAAVEPEPAPVVSEAAVADAAPPKAPVVEQTGTPGTTTKGKAKKVTTTEVEPEAPVPAPASAAVVAPPPPVAPALSGPEQQGTRFALFGGLYALLLLVGLAGTFGAKSEV